MDAAWNPPLPARIHLGSKPIPTLLVWGQRENVVVILPPFFSIWIAWIYALRLIVK